MNLKRYMLFVVTMLLFVSCSPALVVSQNGTYTATSMSFPSPTVIPNDVYSYIGLEYPPLPDTIKTSTSWEILISANPNNGWGIAAVEDQNNLMLWLTQSFNGENGKPYSQVKDVAVLPLTARDQEIVVSACLINNVLDSEIVALVNLDEESLEKRYLSNSHIVMAWKANQTTGKLEQIATTEIECHAETFLSYSRETP